MITEELKQYIKNPEFKNFKNKEGYVVFYVKPHHKTLKLPPCYAGITYSNGFLTWDKANKLEWNSIFETYKYVNLSIIGIFDNHDDAERARDGFIAYNQVFNHSCYYNDIKDTYYHKEFNKINTYKLLNSLIKSNFNIGSILTCYKLTNPLSINLRVKDCINNVNQLLKDNGSKFTLLKKDNTNGHNLEDYYIAKSNNSYMNKELVSKRQDLYKYINTEHFPIGKTLKDTYAVYRKYFIDIHTGKEITTCVDFVFLDDKNYKDHLEDENLKIDIIKFFDNEDDARMLKNNLISYYSLVEHNALPNQKEDISTDNSVGSYVIATLIEEQFKANMSLEFILTMFNRLVPKVYISLKEKIIALDDYLEDNNSKYEICSKSTNSDFEDIKDYYYCLRK